jgi:hypothetical protein
LFGGVDCSQRSSGRADLDCPNEVCEECSECEQICEDCVTDCDSDCRVLLDCDGFDCSSHPYCDMCDIDQSEFDLLGRRDSFWSPLASTLRDVERAEIGDSGGLPEDADPTACVDLRDSGDLLASREDIEFSKDHARALESQASEVVIDHSPASAQDHVPTLCKSPIIPAHPALGALAPPYALPAPSFSTMTMFLPAQCQWDGPTGGACGRIFVSADDLHDHLKVTHGVSSEVFCRWTGCHCGHTTNSPHRFAGGVLRHTWGHSGYRPYKCPTCRVGFAAADVRDEHVANVHLGQKMYSCDIPGCGHECSGISNLRRHKQDRHGAEGFQCEFCNWSGKRRLFPRPQNLRRHFKTCKFVLAMFPEARRAASGKEQRKEWLPPGYGPGHGGMNRAKVVRPI